MTGAKGRIEQNTSKTKDSYIQDFFLIKTFNNIIIYVYNLLFYIFLIIRKLILNKLSSFIYHILYLYLTDNINTLFT